MKLYEIIEIDSGLTVAEMEPGQDSEAVAEQHGGVVVDAGPYKTFEDAYDALVALGAEEEEEE